MAIAATSFEGRKPFAKIIDEIVKTDTSISRGLLQRLKKHEEINVIDNKIVAKNHTMKCLSWIKPTLAGQKKITKNIKKTLTLTPIKWIVLCLFTSCSINMGKHNVVCRFIFFETLPDSAFIRERIIGRFTSYGKVLPGTLVSYQSRGGAEWSRRDMPAPIKLHTGISAWRVGDLRCWLGSQILTIKTKFKVKPTARDLRYLTVML